MKTIQDLRKDLFDTIADLRNKDKPMELDRAKMISEVAQTIINSAKVEVEFIEAIGGIGTDFVPPREIAKLPPMKRI
jgi:hypothetical protein